MFRTDVYKFVLRVFITPIDSPVDIIRRGNKERAIPLYTDTRYVVKCNIFNTVIILYYVVG